MDSEGPPVGNPFLVFPEEVWEAILEKLDSCQDIHNALKAYPQLNVLSTVKQWSWLIGEIMPIVFFKFIDINNMKSCRLVSKRWKYAVDKCLQDHSDRTMYKSTDIQESHFNYHTCRIGTNMKIFLDSEFWKNRCTNEIKHNPFPGGNVMVYVDEETYLDGPTGSGNSRQYPGTVKLSVLSPVIKSFGYHIQHITFSIPYIGYANDESVVRRVLKPMFQCLSMMNNLKSLQIIALTLPTCQLREKGIREISSFPQFSFKLDVLEVPFYHVGSGKGRFDYDLLHHILHAVCKHSKPKRFRIHSTFWRKEYSTYFPNLCELILGTSNLKLAKRLLEDLNCSPIRKLRIEILLNQATVWEIFELLAPYKIECLELGGDVLSYPNFLPSDSPETVLVPSVRYLRLRLDKSLRGVGFNFLEALPSLECITIDSKQMSASLKSGVSTNIKEEGDSEDPLRISLYNLFHYKKKSPRNFAVIWDELNDLKMITVLDYKYMYQYTRECQDRVFRTVCNRH